MKKIFKTLVLTAWVLLAGAVFFGISPVGSASHGAGGLSMAGPAETYANNCAACHGSDGRAKTAKGKRTGATDFTGDWNSNEARGIRIITNGKSEMPTFKRKLTAEEIRGVFRYVLHFRR